MVREKGKEGKKKKKKWNVLECPGREKGERKNKKKKKKILRRLRVRRRKKEGKKKKKKKKEIWMKKIKKYFHNILHIHCHF